MANFTITPDAGKVHQFKNGAQKFRLPCPAHLVVADFERLPIAGNMPEFDAFSVQTSLLSDLYTRCIGPQLIICEQGQIRFICWGDEVEQGVLEPGECLYVPQGVKCTWNTNVAVVCLNKFNVDHNQPFLVQDVTTLVGGVQYFRPALGEHLRLSHQRFVKQVSHTMGMFQRYYLWKPTEVDKWYANHAHTKGEEIFVCRSGAVRVWLHDGKNEENVVLHEDDCLYIPTMVWHKVMAIEPGSTLSVLSDASYTRELHYLEDFESFCTAQQAALRPDRQAAAAE